MLGGEPSPVDRQRVAIGELSALLPGVAVCIAGRAVHVGGRRIQVEDRSGAIVVSLGPCDPPTLGAWVAVRGTWDGERLRAEAIDVASTPARDFPPMHGEWLWFHDHHRRRLRLLEQRAAILRAVRSFFDARGFLEVETPVVVPSPGLDLHLDAFALANSPSPRFLATSPEYHMKRLLAGGLERIYQIGHCFRRGEEGARHQPEFTMLEWYRAFAGSSEVMQDTEELVAHTAHVVLGTTRLRSRDGATIELEPPWERLTVDEAWIRYAGVRVDEVLPDEDRFFLLFAERVEPQLGRERPTFLTEWPASMASLARLLPDRRDRADRFEAFVDGLELCNGFGELVDAAEQRARLERDREVRTARGLPVYPIDERFLAALEEGIPPSGGNALGFDRLVMLLTGARTIDDVVTFSNARL
jgi:lysyl-tRNA synthetase class 2